MPEAAGDHRVRIGVVMLAYGPEPVIDEAIEAVLGSRDVDVCLVVVDNGCERTDLDDLCDRPQIRLIRPGGNLGFTGGVNLGSRQVDSPFLGLVNSDAVVAPDALARLAAVAARPQVGIASGSIRLASDPMTMNSAGNPVHVLGLGWAGGLGDPASAHAVERDVAAASGAGLVLRREVWEELGGFPEEFFAYQEDLELSWRCWQSGWSVRYVPDAVVVHHYEFSRNDLKMYLLERNRLLFVLTCYGSRTLSLLAVPLLAFELAIAVVATTQGWGRRKVAGWRWVLENRRWVRDRRRRVQTSRRVPDRDLVPLWSDRFDPAALALPHWAEPVQLLLAGWWRLVRRAV